MKKKEKITKHIQKRRREHLIIKALIAVFIVLAVATILGYLYAIYLLFKAGII